MGSVGIVCRPGRITVLVARTTGHVLHSYGSELHDDGFESPACVGGGYTVITVSDGKNRLPYF